MDKNNHLQIIEEQQITISAEQIHHRHFGQTLPLRWNQNGQPRLMLGPHYINFICTLIVTAIIAIVMSVNIIINSPHSQFQMSLGITFTIIFYIYNYVKIGLSNPGIASVQQQPAQEMKSNQRYCVPCKIVRPMRTIHCYSCDVCIIEYDHHCPWVGKCIGRDNISAFRRFLMSIFLLLAAMAVCVYVSDTNNLVLSNNMKQINGIPK